MKKLLIAFAAMTLIASCETKVAGDSEKDTSAAADKNAENTNKVYRAIESGDVSGLDSLFTEDVVDHDATPMGDIKGRDSVKAFLSQLHKFIDGLKLEMQHHATSNDGQYHYATTRMTGTATAANPWGMPAGTPVDDVSVDVVKLKDGKCSDHWSFASMKDVGEWMAGMQPANQPAGNKPAEEKKK